MKRRLSVFALFLTACALSGQVDLSAGFGGGLVMIKQTDKYTLGSDWRKETLGTLSWELELFLDAEYASLSFGYSKNSSDADYAVSLASGSRATYDAVAPIGSYLHVAAFAMAPLKLGIGQIYPTIGAEYRFNLSFEDEYGFDLKASLSDDLKKGLNELWLKAGLGIDYPALLKGAYIRTRILGGYKFATSIDDYRNEYGIAYYGADGGEAATWKIEIALCLGFYL
jgi:hypothetical protein